ncbi:MAG: hypothetical protein ACXWP0_12735 [Ktedonobacterales bacterium]
MRSLLAFVHYATLDEPAGKLQAADVQAKLQEERLVAAPLLDHRQAPHVFVRQCVCARCLRHLNAFCMLIDEHGKNLLTPGYRWPPMPALR